MTVYLITGPPCSGKSTLAKRLAKPGDPVLDFDSICTELDNKPGWEHSARVRQEANYIMSDRVEALRGHVGDAYVIRCAPNPYVRTNLSTMLNATTWVLNPGIEECARRARADKRPQRSFNAIMNWYASYRPSSSDVLCPHAAEGVEGQWQASGSEA